MTDEPTVFIVDDEAPLRESLQWLIESIGLRVKTFSSAQTFLDSYDPSVPGCMVLDVRMPGMSGLELQDRLIEQNIDIPTIMVTAYGDVSSAVRAMKKGAIDFVEKPISDQVLLDQIHRGIEIDRQRRADKAEITDISKRVEQLTPREFEVMKLVVEGLSSRQIAQQLFIAVKTVEAHRTKIMKKMGADSISQLTRLYLQYKKGLKL